MAVLAPDCSLLGLIIVWSVEGIVDAGDDGKEPCQDGTDLIPENRLWVVGLPLGERVNWAEVSIFPSLLHRQSCKCNE